MSTDLKAQIRAYGSGLVDDQAPITERDIANLVDKVRALPAAPAREPDEPRVWIAVSVAAAAFVGVVILVGVLAWLIPSGDDAPPAQEPTVVTTLPEQVTVPEPETLADTAVSTTTLATVGIAPVDAPVDVRLGVEVTPELVYLDAYVEGITKSSAWPKPQFDTSALGAESVLIELPPSALTSVVRSTFMIPQGNGPPAEEQPLVAGVQLSGTEHAATYFIGLDFRDGIVYPVWRLIYTPSYTQGTVFEAGSKEGFAGAQRHGLDDQDSPHIILFFEDSGEFAAVIGGLPPEASVVATTLTDGTRVWQRPISSIAIFLDPSACVQDEGPPVCSTEFIVLNANGNEILRLHWDEDPDLDLTVTRP